MSVYQELGLKTIINASDTYTRIGGSRMSDKVLAAMAEAGGHFVNIRELAAKICGRIAAMTGNEAAFISSGAGAWGFCVLRARVSTYLCGRCAPASHRLRGGRLLL